MIFPQILQICAEKYPAELADLRRKKVCGSLRDLRESKYQYLSMKSRTSRNIGSYVSNTACSQSSLTVW